MSVPRIFYRGETRTLDLYIYDSAGEAEDLTLASAIEFELKTLPGAADPALIRKFVGTGIVVEDQGETDTIGHATLTIASGDWASVAAGAYWYDVVAVISGERRYVVKPTPCQVLDVVNQP